MEGRRIDLLRIVPFIALHLACLGVFFVEPVAGALATSRAAQLAFAVLAASAAQRGPLWWASHHRHHHAHADQPADAHSARQHGFAWSHAGWFLSPASFATRTQRVRDFARFPELRWLDRFDVAVPALLAAVLLLIGIEYFVWGFCVSTVVLYHATFTINSLAHTVGTRRYETRDDSRNNGWLALLTFGEGWHNNHHYYPRAARQGFYWWEIDLTWYGLKLLAAFGLVWDLQPVPAKVRDAR